MASKHRQATQLKRISSLLDEIDQWWSRLNQQQGSEVINKLIDLFANDHDSLRLVKNNLVDNKGSRRQRERIRNLLRPPAAGPGNTAGGGQPQQPAAGANQNPQNATELIGKLQDKAGNISRETDKKRKKQQLETFKKQLGKLVKNKVINKNYKKKLLETAKKG